jgi:hypothetical protein
MPILETALSIAVGWAAERLLDQGAETIRARFGEAEARRELEEIAVGATEAAVRAAPSLAEDIRSDSFLNKCHRADGSGPAGRSRRGQRPTGACGHVY